MNRQKPLIVHERSIAERGGRLSFSKRKRAASFSVAGGYAAGDKLSFKTRRLIVSLMTLLLAAVGVLTAGEVLDIGDMPSWSAVCAVNESVVSGGDMEVHVIDVGQGDCVLVRGGGANILIDAGENGMGARVVGYLQAQGITELDCAVCTHPHSDHIGGMDKVILSVPTKAVVMPELPDSIYPTTATFMQLLDAMGDCSLDATYAQVGDSMSFGSMTMTVIYAGSGSIEDGYNDYSLVLRLECGAMSYLCGGDISEKTEQAIVSSGAALKSTLMKADHHGSADSNCAELLDAAAPEHVFITCGAHNDYGHPHDAMLKRLRDRRIEYTRTDICGNIVYSWDGEKLSVTTQN